MHQNLIKFGEWKPAIANNFEEFAARLYKLDGIGFYHEKCLFANAPNTHSRKSTTIVDISFLFNVLYKYKVLHEVLLIFLKLKEQFSISEINFDNECVKDINTNGFL